MDVVVGDDHALLQLQRAAGALNGDGPGAGHVAGLPDGGLDPQLHAVALGQLHLGGLAGRAKDRHALLPALGAHQCDPLLGQELARLRERPLGLQPGAGPEQHLHVGLRQMHVPRGDLHLDQSRPVDRIHHCGYDLFHIPVPPQRYWPARYMHIMI